MTPAAARRRLPNVAAQLERLQAREEALYAERTALFATLDADGMPQKDIATLAGVTPGAVAFALHKARKTADPRNARAS